MVEEWRRILAEEKPRPEWYGDLDDDCAANWAGLLLRAEWEQDDLWFWAVYDEERPEADGSPKQVESSNNHDRHWTSGKSARWAAEAAAREYLGLKPCGPPED